MANLVFDVEKYDRYKTRKEDAHLAYLAANEDFRFERDSFLKSLSFFKSDFPPNNKLYDQAYDSLYQASRMDASNIPAINAALKETLALAEDGTTHKKHLFDLIEQVIVMKKAEVRQNAATQQQRNLGECWQTLEDFARKHIKFKNSTGPTPVADGSMMGSSTGDYYGG
jgi:hypothetical protein